MVGDCRPEGAHHGLLSGIAHVLIVPGESLVGDLEGVEVAEGVTGGLINQKGRKKATGYA